MANQQYNQLSTLIADGMDWERVTIYAFLCEKFTFNPAHQRMSETDGWIKREPLQGRFVDMEGNLCGNPAVFYMVEPEVDYEVVLGYDDGTNNELLLGYFDESYGGVPIQVERRGSLFVRPFTPDGEDPPFYSIWLRPGLA